MRILGVTPDDADDNPHGEDKTNAPRKRKHFNRSYKRSKSLPKFEPPTDATLIEYVHRSIAIRKDWINELAGRLTSRRNEMLALKAEIADIETRLIEAEERLRDHMNALIDQGLLEPHGGQR